VRPGSVRDLACCRRALLHGVRHLVVVEPEHLAQQEDRSFGRRQRFEHEQHGDRQRLGKLDFVRYIGSGQYRLGQPCLAVRLLAPGKRAQPCEGLIRGDPDEVGALVTHRCLVDSGPAQPRLLQDVLGIDDRTQHLVGDREQEASVKDEGLRCSIGRIIAGHVIVPIDLREPYVSPLRPAYVAVLVQPSHASVSA
jgi:hypothetical protein